MAENTQFVTKEMTMGEIIKKYPSAMYALMSCGMGCVGCPSAQAESLEQAAMVHGLKADEVLDFVNRWIHDNESKA